MPTFVILFGELTLSTDFLGGLCDFMDLCDVNELQQLCTPGQDNLDVDFYSVNLSLEYTDFDEVMWSDRRALQCHYTEVRQVVLSRVTI